MITSILTPAQAPGSWRASFPEIEVATRSGRVADLKGYFSTQLLKIAPQYIEIKLTSDLDGIDAVDLQFKEVSVVTTSLTHLTSAEPHDLGFQSIALMDWSGEHLDFRIEFDFGSLDIRCGAFQVL